MGSDGLPLWGNPRLPAHLDTSDVGGVFFYIFTTTVVHGARPVAIEGQVVVAGIVHDEHHCLAFALRVASPQPHFQHGSHLLSGESKKAGFTGCGVSMQVWTIESEDKKIYILVREW